MRHLQGFDYDSVSREEVQYIKNVPLLALNENVSLAAAGFNELLFSVKAYYSVKEAQLRK